MDAIYCMLQQIRKRYGAYLGKKSLSALGHFLQGYSFRIIAELWMKKTKLDLATNYDVFLHSNHTEAPCKCLDGFNAFVHDYYNIEMTVLNDESLILQNTQSEEEAFDKFYELLDMFFAEQRKKGLLPDEIQ